MQNYYFPQKTSDASSGPLGIGIKDTYQTMPVASKGRKPLDPISIDIEEKTPGRGTEGSTYNNTLFSNRSFSSKLDFPSTEISENHPNIGKERINQRNQFEMGVPFRHQQFQQNLPYDHVDPNVFNHMSLKERASNKILSPTLQDYLAGDRNFNSGGTDDFPMSGIHFNSKSDHTAYSAAMKALQKKIKIFEQKLHQMALQNEELNQHLTLETQRSAHTQMELEKYKKNEKEMAKELESLTTERDQLHNQLEQTRSEHSNLEATVKMLKEENLTLREENTARNDQIKSSAKTLQEILSKENEVRLAEEMWKRERELYQKKNEELQSKCERLESELDETKKVYKEHLQELVLKNETLSQQFEASKEMFSNEINDFQRELSNIEISNANTINGLEKDKELLQQKLREMEQTIEEKNKEIEELKENLGKFMNHMLETGIEARSSMGFSKHSPMESPIARTQSRTTPRASHMSQLLLSQQGSQPVQGENGGSIAASSKKILQFQSVTTDTNNATDDPRVTTYKGDSHTKLTPGPRQSKQPAHQTAEKFYTPMHSEHLNLSDMRINEIDSPKLRASYSNQVFPPEESRDTLYMDSVAHGPGKSQKKIPNDQRMMYEHQMYQGAGSNNYPIPNFTGDRPYQSEHGSRNLSFGKKQLASFIGSKNSVETMDAERESNRTSRFNLPDRGSDRFSNNEEQIAIIENIVATQKEIDNLNEEYRVVLEKAQVNLDLKRIRINFVVCVIDYGRQ